MSMQAEICHGGMACSTVMIGEFDGSKQETESFLKDMLCAFSSASEWGEFGSDCWGYDDKPYEWKDLSFVVASTESCQTNTIKNLKEAGFKPSRKVKNKKNGTTVQFWVISVPSLKRKMKEYKLCS